MSLENQKTVTGLKALGHPLRLFIVKLLRNGPLCAGDIESQAGANQSNVSQHLSVLKDSGIVQARREKNQIYYQVSNWRIFKLLAMADDIFGSP